MRAKNSVYLVSLPILVPRHTSGPPLRSGLDFPPTILSAVHVGAIAVPPPPVATTPNIKIAEIHEDVLRYSPVGGIIGSISGREMFPIVDNDYIPILSTNMNTSSYTVCAGKI